MTELRDRLKEIRTFPSLVKFLRDELDWPIDSTDDFEEIVFDYTPEELGIDAANAAKIDEIKRLRKLSETQPWGIFFVKFEPKQLPVVALRRILNEFVVKKRPTGRAAEQQRWATDNLLFISAYGDEYERRISFAHFSQDAEAGDLATLKVLAWDDQDTGLHLDDVASRLVDHLSWPPEAEEWDDETWRERWSAAFELRHREVVTTSKALAIRLAELARGIRVRINEVLAIESGDGPVTKLMNAFREALVHDLEPDDFADMYAQTIAYGLLSARIANPTGDDSATHLPVTNPFLRELMETFLHVGSGGGAASGEIDFDELGVSEVVALLDNARMEAVILDFGDKNPLEDPVIHFYELFLKEYDAKKRMQRGVFYTPRPVVSYIVRSVHELLRTELGLEDGLADTATWAEVADRLDVQIPEGIERGDRFVTILDPATGTGTFLVEAIDVIHRTVAEKWAGEGNNDLDVRRLWNEYVPSQLLPRLHGYELMMAPYAITHLKIGLKLHETGYRFESDERARVYLTNALEPPQDLSERLEFTVPALAHEAHAVNAVKSTGAFTVVTGNPPYSSSTTSNAWVVRLMDDWKKGLDETKVDVMREEWKFLRLAQTFISSAGAGVVGFVINRDFLDGVTKRRLRESLQETFPSRRVVDLNGDVKGEIADENVFEIMQGVCVSVLATPSTEDARTYVSLEGTKESKYAWLLAAEGVGLRPHVPTPPLYKWSARMSGDGGAEYESWFPLNRVFGIYSSGIQTQRDGVCIAWDSQTVWDRVDTIATEPLEEARALLDAGKDGRDWQMATVREDVLASGPSREHITRVLYRPFDVRFTYWTGKTKGFHAYPRRDVMKHVVGRDNIGLIFNRQVWARRSARSVSLAYLPAGVYSILETKDLTIWRRSTCMTTAFSPGPLIVDSICQTSGLNSSPWMFESGRSHHSRILDTCMRCCTAPRIGRDTPVGSRRSLPAFLNHPATRCLRGCLTSALA